MEPIAEGGKVSECQLAWHRFEHFTLQHISDEHRYKVRSNMGADKEMAVSRFPGVEGRNLLDIVLGQRIIKSLGRPTEMAARSPTIAVNDRHEATISTLEGGFQLMLKRYPWYSQ
jgi:hypothetical protein